MNKITYHFMAPALLIVVGLLSCTAGQINVAGPQKTILAPAAGSPIAIACEPSNVVAGDLTNDEKTDLVVACGEARALIVLVGSDKGGGFRASTPIPLADGPGDIVIGDVNGDSNPGSGHGQPR